MLCERFMESRLGQCWVAGVEGRCQCQCWVAGVEGGPSLSSVGGIQANRRLDKQEQRQLSL